MVIISALHPEKLNLKNQKIDEYKNYTIFKIDGNLRFVYLIDSDQVNLWKKVVRQFIDKNENRFFFIGKGKKVSENSLDGCIVEGHVNLSGQNPLIGKNLDRYGPRFFDVSNLYSDKLRKKIFKKTDDLDTGTILVPGSMQNLTELEKTVLNLEDIYFTGITKDIYAGALTAKHAGAEIGALLLFQEACNIKNMIDFKKL
ncbi:MAG: hypothetical protein K9M80_04195 [Candidatus Marinimicrobia bacterium]|nr:hypothetical protein [Candidatus Neomarinimicrobiota bacterium]